MKASRGFRVTYDITTPESAENGEAAESGFVEPGGWRHALGNESAEGMTLREALELCSPQEDCGRWFTETDGRDNYVTGANEMRALHPPRSITPASYARLKRLLGV